MTDTKYARSGNIHLAYQVIGNGPLEVVFSTGTFVPMDMLDEHPLVTRFYRRLASFAKVLMFDKRGIGQSDPISPDALPTMDEQADDLATIIAAAGFTKPAMVAGFDSATYAIALAGTRPDVLGPLIIVNGFAKFLSTEDHPWGFDTLALNDYATLVEGESPELDILELAAPSMVDDRRFRDWWDRAGRRGASPSLALALTNAMFAIDIRDRLAAVTTPTTIIHTIGNRMIPIDEARYLAAHIPQSTLVELPGEDHLIYVDADGILDAIEEALTGARAAPVDRVLATVLFTDIVDSTKLATELGDRKWHALLDVHDEISRDVLHREGGKLIKQTGDGLLATFAGPGPAIRCAMRLREQLATAGLRIRAGIHTGEVEMRGEDVGGIAVHIAARVMGEADGDEIIVSSVVPPLVVGSEIEFTDRGARELKGVPGEWRVLSVDG